MGESHQTLPDGNYHYNFFFYLEDRSLISETAIAAGSYIFHTCMNLNYQYIEKKSKCIFQSVCQFAHNWQILSATARMTKRIIIVRSLCPLGYDDPKNPKIYPNENLTAGLWKNRQLFCALKKKEFYSHYEEMGVYGQSKCPSDILGHIRLKRLYYRWVWSDEWH